MVNKDFVTAFSRLLLAGVTTPSAAAV